MPFIPQIGGISTEQKEEARQAIEAKGSDISPTKTTAKKSFSLFNTAKQKEPKRQDILDRFGSTLKEYGQKYGAIAERVWNPKEGKVMGQNPLSSGLQFTGTTIGLAQDLVFDVAEEITPKPVKEVLETGLNKLLQTKAGEEVIQFAQQYNDWAQHHPQAAADIEAIFNIASIIPAGKGAQLGIKAATKSLGTVETVAKTGVKATEKKLVARTFDEAVDIVKPVLTKKQKTEAIKFGDLETNIIGTTKIKASELDNRIAKSVEGIVAKEAKVEDNIAAIRASISEKGETVSAFLKEHDAIFNKKQLRSQIDQIKDEHSILFRGDESIRKAYDSVIDEYFKILDRHPKNLSGAWEARKEFDDLVRDRLPKAFDDVGNNAQKQAVRDVRQAVNGYIHERLPEGSPFKSSLEEMSLQYRAIDNIADKAAGQVGKNIVSLLEAKIRSNPILSGAGLLGLGGLVSGVLTSPITLGALLTYGVVTLSGKKITLNAVRKQLIKALKKAEKISSKKEAGKVIGGTIGGAVTVESVESLKEIIDLLDQSETEDEF